MFAKVKVELFAVFDEIEEDVFVGSGFFEERMEGRKK